MFTFIHCGMWSRHNITKAGVWLLFLWQASAQGTLGKILFRDADRPADTGTRRTLSRCRTPAIILGFWSGHQYLVREIARVYTAPSSKAGALIFVGDYYRKVGTRIRTKPQVPAGQLTQLWVLVTLLSLFRQAYSSCQMVEGRRSNESITSHSQHWLCKHHSL